MGYHLLEAYLIVPRVYGQRLRLSTLAFLLALMAGTTLQGLIGAVLVLPLVGRRARRHAGTELTSGPDRRRR